MGRTIIGEYIPVLLAVMLFVAAGFQHSPANMGFFVLHIAHGGDLSWLTAFGWNTIPAGIGNMLGAAVLRGRIARIGAPRPFHSRPWPLGIVVDDTDVFVRASAELLDPTGSPQLSDHARATLQRNVERFEMLLEEGVLFCVPQVSLEPSDG